MKNIFLLTLILLAQVSCNDLDDKLADCSGVACTEEFVTLIVSVQDNSGVAIPLERFEVINSETQENVAIALSDSELRFSQLTGEFPLYNDLSVATDQNTSKTLIFRGYINENIVAEAEFVVAADCCHVRLVSGDTIILVN